MLSLFIGTLSTNEWVALASHLAIMGYLLYWVVIYIRTLIFYYGIYDEASYISRQEAVAQIWKNYGMDVLIESAYDTDATVVSYIFYTLMFAGGLLIGNWIILGEIILITFTIWLVKLQIESILDSIVFKKTFSDWEEEYID